MSGLRIMKWWCKMNNNMLVVQKVIKLNEEEQKSLLRAFSRLPLDNKIELMTHHRSLLHKLRQFYSDITVNVLSYCALITAIQVYQNKQVALKKLNIGDMSLEEIREITSKKAKLFLQKQFRRQTKRERLLGYWAVVKTLKESEDFSFRQIENYLKKHHRFEVSYSMIAKLWYEVENTTDEEESYE